MKHKILVAYFSASGVTAKLAEVLAETAGADLYEIQPAQAYTSADLNWMDQKSRSSVEMKDPHFRPAIGNPIDGIQQYDTIFVGFPIWWYAAPTIIHTFLERYDFSGKTVIPFATSGGSGLGKTDDILKQCCSTATKWKPGRCFKNAEKSALRSWLDALDLSKDRKDA